MKSSQAMPLHRVVSGRQLHSALDERLQEPLIAVVQELHSESAVVAVVAGGSIPLGLATAASDIDLIAVTAPSRNLGNGGPTAVGVQFDGTSGSLSSGPAFREQVVKRNGLELDIVSAQSAQLLSALHELATRSVALNLAEIRLLSRLKTGWWLFTEEGWYSTLRPLQDDRNLDVRVTAWHYVAAVQDFDDAVAALDDSLPLAAHLGRQSAERALFAYLASMGWSYVGTKWLRILSEHHESPQRIKLRGALLALSSFSTELFFPQPTDRLGVESSLRAISQFLQETRTMIERDLMMKVALARTKQVPASGEGGY